MLSGIYLQSLYLSNMLQILGRYGAMKCVNHRYVLITIAVNPPRFISACLMHCWLLRSCQRNTEIVVRIYCATTVIKRGPRNSTGYIINVDYVDLTTPG
uniref:Uncharacterized protein n=1 Tax=Salix viminalis TaxID=40686 RepID=A0A6N2KBA0_SALVM